jgi:tetratricopeptide (TPR) repeat protein
MLSINWFMALANGNLGLVGLMIWLAGVRLCARAESPAAETNFAAYVRGNYHQAEARYRNGPNDAEAAWQFARACFDLADLAATRAERAAMAERGIAACRGAVAREPNLAPAHYYLGMNLAQLAQTKSLGALKLVDQMEREFSLARKLDEQFDRAGSDRNLGLLYRDAPALVSIGSRAKARQHLQRAVELAPLYPENRLNLIEAYLKWGDHGGARRELPALEDMWPGARANLTGIAWAASWEDWEARLKKVRKEVQGSAKTVAAPRSQP